MICHALWEHYLALLFVRSLAGNNCPGTSQHADVMYGNVASVHGFEFKCFNSLSTRIDHFFFFFVIHEHLCPWHIIYFYWYWDATRYLIRNHSCNKKLQNSHRHKQRPFYFRENLPFHFPPFSSKEFLSSGNAEGKQTLTMNAYMQYTFSMPACKCLRNLRHSDHRDILR